jgi:hypothetical protein
MRLFPKKPFSRSSRHNKPAEESIGSDISTKDQFDIIVPVRSKQHSRAAAVAAGSSARPWGSGLMGMGGLLDKASGSGAAPAGGGGDDDDTSVSSITTSPEWQQPRPGSPHGPHGATGSSRRGQRSSSGSGPDDGRSSWACCGCGPLSTVAGGDGEEEEDATGEGGTGGFKGGTLSPTAENTLAPTTHYEPMACARGGVGAPAAAAAGSLISPPSILNHEGTVAAAPPPPADAEAAPPPNVAVAPPSSSAWCCAAAVGGLCPLAGSASQGASPGADAAAAAAALDRNHHRSSYSLFDGLDDDDPRHRRGHGSNKGGSGGGGGGGRGSLPRKIRRSLRRAMGAPPLWGSHLRSRTRSFRRSSGNGGGGADDHDREPSLGQGDLAILATTHQDDRYYWRGTQAACVAAE